MAPSKRKRCGGQTEPESGQSELVSELDSAELTSLRAWRDALLQPVRTAGACFNMQRQNDKVLCAQAIWLGDYVKSMEHLRKANPELVQVIDAQVQSQYAAEADRHARLVNGVLLNIVRAQSQFNVPLVTAAFTVLSDVQGVQHTFHETVRRNFPGALMTVSWGEGFLALANANRPAPDDEMLQGVQVGVFDNLSMKCNYGSYVTQEAGGELKHMTNWLTAEIPKRLAPPGFNADYLFVRGIFRNDRSCGYFSRQFYLDSPEVASNRASRWGRFFNALKSGRLLDRPRVRPTWAPHKEYMPPMFDRLQSKYEDVRHEMRVMREKYPSSRILFIAGDGLSLMRMNHLLASEYDEFLDQSPAVVPIQGELHGLFHAMHCQWRLYRPFIMKCAAELGNDQIKEDPGVSDYNVHRFFLLNILMPAAMEYVVEISGSPGADDLDDPVPIMAKAKANVNFDWLVHFLHDCAFFTLDFLQSIRGNDSAKIDILWREFFSSAHTDTANKTQYTGMAIMRVFWGMGLVPDLDALYHAIRTIPSGEHLGCGVGWDWAIEMLNGAIKKHVGAHVSEAQIRKFVESWACLEEVQKHMREVLAESKAEKHWRGRNVRADIDLLKTFFRDKIGQTWAEAIQPDSTPRVVRRAAGHSVRTPWKQVEEVMARRGQAAPHAFIERYVRSMTPFFTWMP